VSAREPARHLLHVFSTFVAAGPQVRTVELVRALGPAYRHSFVALDGRTQAFDLLRGNAGARLLAAPLAGGPLARMGTLARVRGLRRLMDRERADLVLTYNWGSFDAILAARGRGAPPHVHHEDGFNADEAVRQKRRRIWLRRFGLRRARRVVVVSERLLQIALEVWKLPRARVQLIRNGIEVERFATRGPAGEVRERLGIAPDALVVGTVGHLRPVKRLERLLEAAARADPTRLGRALHVLVVGEGPERAALEDAARRRPPPGGAVHFVGHQSELSPFYAAMDVFALSSDSEQLPVALLEALASGLAVAATDVGDVRVVLPPEQAPFVVPVEEPTRPQRLAAALETLLCNAALRRSLASANRERVSKAYSFQAMQRAYRDLYEEAMAARPSAASVPDSSS